MPWRCRTSTAGRSLTRQGEPEQVGVLEDLSLAATRCDPLPKVALAVQEAEPDDGDAEIACRLEVVAREHLEPASEDRDALGEPELRREMGGEWHMAASVSPCEPG